MKEIMSKYLKMLYNHNEPKNNTKNGSLSNSENPKCEENNNSSKEGKSPPVQSFIKAVRTFPILIIL